MNFLFYISKTHEVPKAIARFSYEGSIADANRLKNRLNKLLDYSYEKNVLRDYDNYKKQKIIEIDEYNNIKIILHKNNININNILINKFPPFLLTYEEFKKQMVLTPKRQYTFKQIRKINKNVKNTF